MPRIEVGLQIGSLKKGEANGNARLSESDVLEIRARCTAGDNKKNIANEFGVTRDTIFRIARRDTWTHI